ncbi:hypothetical protein AZF37_07185 [endosymbiont 'TC1' of Trimyema compressum]|uniref:LexA family protein n=1 Tax=endosymbiont 'TC1' of Trimyema compressum TaxID=243899 RepID=UPI0007F13102|nr:S24 family peptidase [endosymbiont 'TC1' of Trimyema compressum]AMP20972.1 hypothetical protein AZF37_07185 [endosymbiont 'TC1' of Trimyema compressum]
MSKNREYFALKAFSNSMYPKIEDGDMLIVRKQPSFENGETGIAIVNGNDKTIKKIKIDETGIILIPLNMIDFEPIFYSCEKAKSLPVQIVGRVEEVRKTL